MSILLSMHVSYINARIGNSFELSNNFNLSNFGHLGRNTVELVTPVPHLSFVASFDSKHRKFLHGISKVLEESLLVICIELHKRLCPWVNSKNGIRGQQPQTLDDILVVGIVKLPW